MAHNNSPAQTVSHYLKAYISGSEEARTSIIASYVYGSALDPAKFKQHSDIDLAFLLEHTLYNQDPLIASAPAYMAAAEIGMRLGRQTDVIILNAASIETAYQAVTTGETVYEADHEKRLEYEAQIRGLYFDFKPFLQALRKPGLRHTKNTEFGV